MLLISYTLITFRKECWGSNRILLNHVVTPSNYYENALLAASTWHRLLGKGHWGCMNCMLGNNKILAWNQCPWMVSSSHSVSHLAKAKSRKCARCHANVKDLERLKLDIKAGTEAKTVKVIEREGGHKLCWWNTEGRMDCFLRWLA